MPPPRARAGAPAAAATAAMLALVGVALQPQAAVSMLSAAPDECPEVSAVPPVDKMCFALNITVKNTLNVPLEWKDSTCTNSNLLAVDPGNESLVRLPDEGEVFIPAGQERKLLAWRDRRTLAGCSDLLDPKPSGTFRMQLHFHPDALVQLYYTMEPASPGRLALAPPGWQAPSLGMAGFWGWNISVPDSKWAERTGTSTVTFIVAGCGAPTFARHGKAPEGPKAIAEKRRGADSSQKINCQKVDCRTAFTNCCVSQAEYQCHEFWDLQNLPSSKDYEPSICTADGSWSNPDNSICTTRCGLDPEDPYATVTDRAYEEVYECERGFDLVGHGTPRSCPPKQQGCSHPQPAYRRRCESNRLWVLQPNHSTGDVTQCEKHPDRPCCVSSCGEWPLSPNAQSRTTADGRSAIYTCDPGFVMDEPALNGTSTMRCQWSDGVSIDGDSGYSRVPQTPPECKCKESSSVSVPAGWKYKVIGVNRLSVKCGGSSKTYTCNRGNFIFIQTPDADVSALYCCTGELDSPVSKQTPCNPSWSAMNREVEYVLAGASSISLMVCCWCLCRKCGWHSNGNGLRTTLGNRFSGIGVDTAVRSSANPRTSWIDPRMSFASQMQARVERAADQRSRREHIVEGSNRTRGPTATSRSVDSIPSSESRQADGAATGRSRPTSPSSAVTSSRHIAHFKDSGQAPDMIPFESLRLFGKIGIGASGVVFEGELKGTKVAVKRLNLILDVGTFEQFLAEVSMLTKAKHPNVVLFFGVSFDDRDHDCYLVTEYCDRGNLQEFLQQNLNVSRTLKLQMALDVARGMNFLHQSDIVHRDLKSANVLVTEGLKMKICDFGISRTVDGTHTTDMTGSIGTIAWSAPEMLSGSSYTSAVDVYAFGILLWEIATQKAPYEGITSVKIISSVIGGLRPMVPMPSDGDAYIPGVDVLMEECWDQRPEKRPIFDSIAGRLDDMLRTESSPSGLE